MPKFIESDLIFNFPASWKVRAFDDHRFYQAISGKGLKAVDFLILHPNGSLWLMEVKNYVPRKDAGGQIHPIDLPEPAYLSQQLAEKITDSQRVLKVINLYYRRKWYYRFRLWCSSWYPFALPDSDLLFWTKAAKRSDEHPLQAVLYLQTEQHDLHFRRSISQALQQMPQSWKIMSTMGWEIETQL